MLFGVASGIPNVCRLGTEATGTQTAYILILVKTTFFTMETIGQRRPLCSGSMQVCSFTATFIKGTAFSP